MVPTDPFPKLIAELLQGFPVVVEQNVVWGEMDAYNHVNNVVYFRYFENSRLAYIGRLDWFAFEEETGIGPILAATQLALRRPLTYPDTIAIGSSQGSRPRSLSPGALYHQPGTGPNRHAGRGHHRHL